MFQGYVNSLLGEMEIQERGGHYEVLGIRAWGLVADMQKFWGGQTLAENMFMKINQRSMIIHQFFLPDLYYCLKRMVATPRKVRAAGRRQVQHLLELIEQKTWIKNTLKPGHGVLDRSQLHKFHYSPLPHQSEFFDVYDAKIKPYNLNGFLLASSPGSGKTYQGYCISEMLKTDVTIVVCPKNTVTDVWELSSESLFKEPPKIWTTVMGKPLEAGYRYYVFHYEYLTQAVEWASKTRLGRVNIILDECHNLNQEESLRTVMFLKLCQVVKSVSNLWMSGTPLKAMGAEVIPLLRSICPDFDDHAQRAYRIIYGKSSLRGVDILANRLGLVMHIVPKEVIVKNQVTTERIEITIPNAQHYTLRSIAAEMTKYITEQTKYYQANYGKFSKIYNDVATKYEAHHVRTPAEKAEWQQYRQMVAIVSSSRDYRMLGEEIKYTNQYEATKIAPTLSTEDRRAFMDAKSVVKYIPLKVRGEALGRVLGSKRAECHVEMVPYMNLGEIINEGLSKTLIFTDYVRVVDAVNDHLVKEGFKPLVVYGDTASDLPSIMQQLTDDPDANPVIATYKSLSTGVPVLQCSQIVMINQPFRGYIKDQAVSRVDRLGQKHPITNYEIFLDTKQEPNISTRSEEIMKYCDEMVAMLTGTADAAFNATIALESLLQRDAQIYHVLPEDVRYYDVPAI